MIRLIFLFAFYILYNVKNIHKNRHGITGNGEGGKRKESWTDVGASVASGCSVCVLCVCVSPGSVFAHRLQALLSVFVLYRW